MALRSRTHPHAWSTAVLLNVLCYAAAAGAQPAPHPAVTPAPRVDLGAPDARCPDLAYPLWDDGMCVRAKCADDNACEFSKVARATTPAPPTGLAQERWRTAKAQPATAPTDKAAPIQFASASVRIRGKRPVAALPLLAEARALDPRAGASRARSSERLARGGAVASERVTESPSIWSRIRSALSRLWRWIQTLNRRFGLDDNAAAPKGTS